MTPPSLSIILLTTGKQPLLRFSLASLLPQLSERDQLIISINSLNTAFIENTRSLIKEVDTENKAQIVQTGATFSIYEHYTFAVEIAANQHLMLAHDDEIYNSTVLDEFRKGFSDPAVGVVVGGLLKVEPLANLVAPEIANNFTETKFCNGLEWIKQEPSLYPRFCYSSLAINKDALDLKLLDAASTAADCLAVTQQAIWGKVYQSKEIFATWLQLPTRLSRWFALTPGLTPPWKEFSEYFNSTGDPILIQRGIDSKRLSLRSFIRLLFLIGVTNRNRPQIDTCLKQISYISQWHANILSIVRFPIIYWLLSIPLRTARWIKKKKLNKAGKNNTLSQKAPEILKIDPDFWNSYVEKVLKLK